MSKRAKQNRAKYSAEVSEVAEAPLEEIVIDAWEPNYARACENCGQRPCVSGVTGGKVVYDGTMCGVCTWGEAACLDPANW